MPRDFEVSATVGEQTFGSGGDQFDYSYYSAGVTKTIGNWGIDLRWNDSSNIDPGFVDPHLAEGNLVVGITRNF